MMSTDSNKKINSSPDRNTFHLENYVRRCEAEGTVPSKDYLDLFKSYKQQDEDNMVNPEWQKNNMEYDLRSAKWICDKAAASNSYAQNLYAAMCNMQFQKLEVMPILKEEKWSCSWRHAGGIVADMLEVGDYIEWYCSGSHVTNENGHVCEGVVTDEISNDLKTLGWVPVKWPEDLD